MQETRVEESERRARQSQEEMTLESLMSKYMPPAENSLKRLPLEPEGPADSRREHYTSGTSNHKCK